MRRRFINAAGGAGLFCAAAAFAAATLMPTRPLVSGAAGAAAFALLAVFFYYHFEAFRSFSRMRSTQLGANSVLMIVLAVFLAVILNLTVRQYYFRIDLSGAEHFSLSPQTRSVLRGLNAPVRVIAFGREGEPSMQRARELLESYRHLNRNILYEVRDLDRSPVLAQEMGVGSYNTVAAVGGGAPAVVTGLDEQALTNSIIKATGIAGHTIHFTSGHGERPFSAAGRDGMSRAAEALRAQGHRVEGLALPAVDAVPDGVQVIVIAGPRERFSRADAGKISAFLARGGKVLALFDPPYDPSALTAGSGIALREGTITDPGSRFGGAGEGVPVISRYGDSPVTREFRLSTVFPGAAALRIDEKKGYEYVRIAAAGPETRLVKAGRVLDAAGGHLLAAAAGSREGTDIILVFGSAAFASNAYFNVLGNGNLFLNSVNWLAGEAALVAIAPRADDFIPLYLTPAQGATLFYGAVIVIPASIAALGAVVWWKRRRR